MAVSLATQSYAIVGSWEVKGLIPPLINWSAGFFGVHSPVRSALTASAREAHPETRLLIIGDTPFDRLAAKAAGIPFLAVRTGTYDLSAFEGSEAMAVVDTL
jgi:phosphoglycolate phosphatase